VLRSLATLGAAYDTANTLTEEQRDGLARRALDDLRNTPDPLNRIRARIGSAEARIETVKASHVANEAALTLGYNALAGRDTLEAASLLQETEGQLEILFLTTARMSSLSLANFLR
jgi:flagellar hook-associated protein 3 FlgL